MKIHPAVIQSERERAKPNPFAELRIEAPRSRAPEYPFQQQESRPDVDPQVDFSVSSVIDCSVDFSI